jgi:hypothetical protein
VVVVATTVPLTSRELHHNTGHTGLGCTLKTIPIGIEPDIIADAGRRQVKADVVGMVVVSVDARRQPNNRLGAHHHGVGVAEASVVVAAGLVGPNAHPHLRVALLGDHIGKQRRLRGVDTHLVVGRRVQIAVGVAVCLIR